MLYAALATDYDGTIALHGRVDDAMIDCLKWLKDRGKTLILVTGRELPDLQRVFPETGLFDAVVAENGALLFLPKEAVTRPLGPVPPSELVTALEAKGVTPLSVGTSIVATWSPNEAIVLDTVRELGLEWQIIFNKGAVMCLPPGINKASGLAAALDHLRLSPLNVIGVGDAENDHAFMTVCGYSVAVANALDAVKQQADLVTKADHGAGVAELIETWINDEAFGTRMRRHGATIGTAEAGPVHVLPARHAILVAGSSGAGKSSLATALIESVVATGAQLVVVDPEGDYESIADVSHLGTAERAPSIAEAAALVDQPQVSLILGLLGVELADQPAFLAELLGALLDMRAKQGRPHWLLFDESHHFLPAEPNASAAALPETLPGAIFIATMPEALAPSVLSLVNTLVAAGDQAEAVVAQFCAARELARPPLPPQPGESEAWFWEIDTAPPVLIEVPESRAEHQRHIRKYAEGKLGDDKSFFFRGPENKLKLRAQNLTAFLDLAEGVDDETWLHHLARGDYSQWLEEAIGDEELAAEVTAIEAAGDRDPHTTRAAVRAAIQRRYTAPTG